MAVNPDPLQPAWLQALRNPATYSHPIGDVEVVETHISWVALTGDWAYKLKKPVDFGFVDFTTLELRQAACHEELRLNRRTAPEIYDDVVALTDDPNGPRFGGTGTVLEYAVRMRQFPQENLLDQQLAHGQLNVAVIDDLAREVAALHQHAAVAPVDSPYGDPVSIHNVVQACLDQLARTSLSDDMVQLRSDLDHWTNTEWTRLKKTFLERKQQGDVRECHGDLHLGNLVMYRGRPTLFDCLEFNPDLRWIDIVCDVAFLVMDLFDRDASPLAWRVLNEWLQQTGDYGGLRLLRYYLTYRALVRAKVAALRMQQLASQQTELQHQQELLQSYLELAKRMTLSQQPVIVLMNGVSGSGKSFVARELASSLGAVQIRSDVERKRILHLWPPDESTADDPSLYTPEATTKTYERLQDLARVIVDYGYRVIVDAAFLRQSDRLSFATLADALGVRMLIVHCTAPEAVLKRRIAQRRSQGGDPSDADLAVLENQLASRESFTASETQVCLTVDTDADDLQEFCHSLAVTKVNSP